MVDSCETKFGFVERTPTCKLTISIALIEGFWDREEVTVHFYISARAGADGECLAAIENRTRLYIHIFRNRMRVEPHLRRTSHGLSSIRSA